MVDPVTRDRLLGRGLAFTPTLPGFDLARDIEFVAGPGGRELRQVRGIDNLAQDLAVALTTAVGSDVFDTSFGFDGLRVIGEAAEPVLTRERVRVAVIAVLKRDPRVRRIVDVRLDDGRLSVERPDTPEARALRAARKLEVRVSFETIAAEIVDLAVGVVNG